MTLCPVCGFELDFTPWTDSTAMDKPCPCCGIHFGHDDLIAAQRELIYTSWRVRWIRDGKRWWSTKPQPADFDADEQLKRLHSSAPPAR